MILDVTGTPEGVDLRSQFSIICSIAGIMFSAGNVLYLLQE